MTISKQPPIGQQAATKAASRLCGYFPQSAATDPRVFMVGLVQLLASYPLSVVESILSPLSGLPAKHEFLPSLKVIKEACEARDHRPIERPLALAAPEIPRENRPTVAELKDKYGSTWGLKAFDVQKKRWLTSGELMAAGSLSQEQWDAIPKAGEAPGFKKCQSASG